MSWVKNSLDQNNIAKCSNKHKCNGGFKYKLKQCTAKQPESMHSEVFANDHILTI